MLQQVLRVACTISDLAGSDAITAPLRSRLRMGVGCDENAGMRAGVWIRAEPTAQRHGNIQ